jgi:ubiquinone/menaquinone biosynthesis C-methylase UbiE
MQTTLCLSCDNSDLHEFQNFPFLRRVTSDARSFARDGRLFACKRCSLVQKICDDKWLNEIKHIYADYRTFSVEGEHDQPIYDQKLREMRPRCSVVMEFLNPFLPTKNEKMSWLDYGCGRGAMLTAVDENAYKKYGYDLNRNHERYLNKIVGFETLYVENLAVPNSHFDVISMIHSLEHFTDPLAELRDSRRMLRDNGILVVQVCDTEQNAFDILVADHLTHFTVKTLHNLVSSAGFEVITIDNHPVKKEITLVAIKTSVPTSIVPVCVSGVISAIADNIDWLESARQMLLSELTEKDFGIYGTSNAALWFYTEADGRVDFFVDDDLQKVGKRFKGKPIISPSELNERHTVFVGLPPVTSSLIVERFSNSPVKFVTP